MYNTDLETITRIPIITMFLVFQKLKVVKNSNYFFIAPYKIFIFGGFKKKFYFCKPK